MNVIKYTGQVTLKDFDPFQREFPISVDQNRHLVSRNWHITRMFEVIKARHVWVANALGSQFNRDDYELL